MESKHEYNGQIVKDKNNNKHDEKMMKDKNEYDEGIIKNEEKHDEEVKQGKDEHNERIMEKIIEHIAVEKKKYDVKEYEDINFVFREVL